MQYSKSKGPGMHCAGVALIQEHVGAVQGRSREGQAYGGRSWSMACLVVLRKYCSDCFLFPQLNKKQSQQLRGRLGGSEARHLRKRTEVLRTEASLRESQQDGNVFAPSHMQLLRCSSERPEVGSSRAGIFQASTANGKRSKGVIMMVDYE